MDQALSSDGTPVPDDEVSLAELAALRAGELSAEEEARVRMRMAGEPEVENKLWALDNVHRLFEKPGHRAALPADMPYDIAARLQARIVEEALHHFDPDTPGEKASSRDPENDELKGSANESDRSPGNLDE